MIRKYLKSIVTPYATKFGKDGRCSVCKQHQYLVLDTYPERSNIIAMHSDIALNEKQLGANHWIHWWLVDGAIYPTAWHSDYYNFTGYYPSSCLEFYKEIYE